MGGPKHAHVHYMYTHPKIDQTVKWPRGINETTTLDLRTRCTHAHDLTLTIHGELYRQTTPRAAPAAGCRATRDRRASPRESRVVNSRASRAVARAVARCGLLLLLLRLHIRCIHHIMRTQSTITTWITRGIVDVTLCVHTRMSEFSTDDASRRIHRSVGTGRRARQSRCERCGAFERDSRRFATRAIPRGVHGNADRRATTARRSR